MGFFTSTMKCPDAMPAQDPEYPRLMLRNVRLNVNKWDIRSFLEGIGLMPLDIQCCKMDRVMIPRHQTVFCDLQTDTWLMQKGYNQKCF